MAGLEKLEPLVVGALLAESFSEPCEARFIKKWQAAIEVESILGSSMLGFQEKLDFGAQVSNSGAILEAFIKWPRDVRSSLVVPGGASDILEQYVVLPWLGPAHTEPKVSALVQDRCTSVRKDRSQTAGRGPHIETR